MDLRAHHEHRRHSLADIPLLKWVTNSNATMGRLTQTATPYSGESRAN